MKYKIKIYYSTGNSFGTYNTETYLELTFKDLEIAKANLIRIKEHLVFLTKAAKVCRICVDSSTRYGHFRPFRQGVHHEYQ